MKHLLLTFAILVVYSALASAQMSRVAQADQTAIPSSTPFALVTPNKTNSYTNSSGKTQSYAIVHVQPKQTVSLLLPNLLSADCYTLDVYKVKRTERVKDDESAVRGYSTCEPGFDFQVRTAVATQHDRSNGK